MQVSLFPFPLSIPPLIVFNVSHQIILPAELAAAAVLINYWNKTVNNGVWIAVCLIVVLAINFAGAGVYGECEFWFASIKILTIVGLIILGIILTAGGGPDGQKIGFKYWKDPVRARFI